MLIMYYVCKTNLFFLFFRMANKKSTNSDWFGFAWLTDDYVPPQETEDSVNKEDNGKAEVETDNKEQSDSASVISDTKIIAESDTANDDVKQSKCLETKQSVEGTSAETVAPQNMTGFKAKKKLARTSNPSFTPPTTPTKSSKSTSLQLLDSPSSVTSSPLKSSSVESSPVNKCSVVLQKNPILENLPRQNSIENVFAFVNDKIEMKTDLGTESSLERKRKLSSSESESSVSSLKRQNSCDKKTDIMIFNTGIEVRKSGRLKSAKCSSRYRGDYGIRAEVVTKLSNIKNSDDESNKLTMEAKSANHQTDVSVNDKKCKQEDSNFTKVGVELKVRLRSEQEEIVNQTLDAKSQMNIQNEPCSVNIDQRSEPKSMKVSYTEKEKTDKVENVQNQKDRESTLNKTNTEPVNNESQYRDVSTSDGRKKFNQRNTNEHQGHDSLQSAQKDDGSEFANSQNSDEIRTHKGVKSKDSETRKQTNRNLAQENEPDSSSKEKPVFKPGFFYATGHVKLHSKKNDGRQIRLNMKQTKALVRKKVGPKLRTHITLQTGVKEKETENIISSEEESDQRVVSENEAKNRSDNIVNTQSEGKTIDENFSVVSEIISESITGEIKRPEAGGDGFKANESCSSSEFHIIPAMEKHSKCQETVRLEVCDNIPNVPSDQIRIQESDINEPGKGQIPVSAQVLEAQICEETKEKPLNIARASSRTVYKSSHLAQTTDRGERRANPGSYSHSISKFVSKQKQRINEKSPESTIKKSPSIERTESIPSFSESEDDLPKDSSVSVLESLRLRLFASAGVNPVEVVDKPKVFESKIKQPKVKTSSDLNKVSAKISDQEFKLQQNNDFSLKNLNKTVVDNESNKSVHFSSRSSNISGHSTPRSSSPSSEILEEVSKNLESLQKAKRKLDRPLVRKPKRPRFEQKKFLLRSMVPKPAESDSDSHSSVSAVDSEDSVKSTDKQKKQPKSTIHTDNKKSQKQVVPSSKGKVVTDNRTNAKYSRLRDSKTPQSTARKQLVKPKPAKCHACGHVFKNKDLLKKHYPCRMRQTRTWSQNKLRPNRVFRYVDAPPKEQGRKRFICLLPKSKKQDPNKPRPQLLTVRKPKFKRVKGKRRRKLYMVLQELAEKRRPKTYPHLCVNYENMTTKSQFFYKLGLFSPTIAEHSSALDFFHPKIVKEGNNEHDKENIFEGSQFVGLESNQKSMQHLPKGYESLTFDKFQKSQSIYTIPIEQLVKEIGDGCQINYIENADINSLNKNKNKQASLSVHGTETPPLLEKFEMPGDLTEHNDKAVVVDKDTNEPPVLELQFESPKKQQTERHYLDFAVDPSCKDSSEMKGHQSTDDLKNEEFKISVRNITKLKDVSNSQAKNTVQRHFTDIIEVGEISAKSKDGSFSNDNALWEQSEKGEMTLSEIREMLKPQSRMENAFSKESLLKLRSDLAKLLANVKTPVKSDTRPAVHTAELSSDKSGIEALDIDFSAYERKSLFESLENVQTSSFVRQSSLDETGGSSSGSESSSPEHSDPYKSSLDYEQDLLPPSYEVESVDSSTKGCITDNILQMLNTLEDKGSVAENMSNLLQILAENLGIIDSSKQNESREGSEVEKLEERKQASYKLDNQKPVPENVFETEESYKYKGEGSEKLMDDHQAEISKYPQELPDYKKAIVKESTLFKSITELNSIETDSDSNLGESYDVETMSKRLEELKAAHCASASDINYDAVSDDKENDDDCVSETTSEKYKENIEGKIKPFNTKNDKEEILMVERPVVSVSPTAIAYDSDITGSGEESNRTVEERPRLIMKIKIPAGASFDTSDDNSSHKDSSSCTSASVKSSDASDAEEVGRSEDDTLVEAETSIIDETSKTVVEEDRDVIPFVETNEVDAKMNKSVVLQDDTVLTPYTDVDVEVRPDITDTPDKSTTSEHIESTAGESTETICEVLPFARRLKLNTALTIGDSFDYESDSCSSFERDVSVVPRVGTSPKATDDSSIKFDVNTMECADSKLMNNEKQYPKSNEHEDVCSIMPSIEITQGSTINSDANEKMNTVKTAGILDGTSCNKINDKHKVDPVASISTSKDHNFKDTNQTPKDSNESLNMESNHMLTLSDGQPKSLDKVDNEGEIPESIAFGRNRNTELCRYPESHSDVFINEEQTLSVNDKGSCYVETGVKTYIQDAQADSEKIQELDLGFETANVDQDIHTVQAADVGNDLREMQTLSLATEEHSKCSEEAAAEIFHAKGTEMPETLPNTFDLDKSFGKEKTSLAFDNRLGVDVRQNKEVSSNHDLNIPQISEVDSDLVKCSAEVASINDSSGFINDADRVTHDDESSQVNVAKLSSGHHTVPQKLCSENLGITPSQHSASDSKFHTLDIHTSSDKDSHVKQHKTTHYNSNSKNLRAGGNVLEKNQEQSGNRKDSKSKDLKDVKSNRPRSRPEEKTNKASSRSVERKKKIKESESKKTVTYSSQQKNKSDKGSLQKHKSDKPVKSVQNTKTRICPEENKKKIVDQSDVKRVDKVEVNSKAELNRTDSDHNDIKMQTVDGNVQENKFEKVESSVQGTKTNFHTERRNENKKTIVAHSGVKKVDDVEIGVKAKGIRTDFDHIGIKVPSTDISLEEQKNYDNLLKSKEGKMNIPAYLMGANSESQFKSNLRGNNIADESKRDTESNKRRRISVTDYLSRVKRQENSKQKEDETMKVHVRSSKASMSSENSSENSSKSAPDIVIDENMYDVDKASQNWHNPSVYVKKAHSDCGNTSNQTNKAALGFSYNKDKHKIETTVESLDSLFQKDEMPLEKEENSNRFVAMPLTKKSDIMSIENKTFPSAESANKSIVNSKQNVTEETTPFKEEELTKSNDDVLDIFDSLFSLGETVLSLNKSEGNPKENEPLRKEDEGNLFNTTETRKKVEEGIMRESIAEKQVNNPSPEHEVTEVIDLTETLDDNLTEKEGKCRGLFLDFTDWLTQTDNVGGVILGESLKKSESRKNEHTICTAPGNCLSQLNGFSGVHLNRFRYNIFDFEEEYFEISAKTERTETNPIVAASEAIEKKAFFMDNSSNTIINETVSCINSSSTKTMHIEHDQSIHLQREDNDVANSDNEGYEDDDFADMLAAQMALNAEAMSLNISTMAEEKTSENIATLYVEKTSSDRQENVVALSGGNTSVVSSDSNALLSEEKSSSENVAALSKEKDSSVSPESTATLSEEKSLDSLKPVTDLSENRTFTENPENVVPVFERNSPSRNTDNVATLCKENALSQKKAALLLDENGMKACEEITAGLMKVKAFKKEGEIAAGLVKANALESEQSSAALAEENNLSEEEDTSAKITKEKAIRESAESAAALAKENALREQEDIAAAKAKEKALREQEELAAAKAKERVLREQEEIAAAKAKERALREQQEIAAARAKERAIREQEEIAAALEEERAYLENVEKAAALAEEVKQNQEEAAALAKKKKKKKAADLETKDKAAALAAAETYIASQETVGNKYLGILENKNRTAALAVDKTYNASQEEPACFENKDKQAVFATGKAYTASGEKASAQRNKDKAATFVAGETYIASQQKTTASVSKKDKTESQTKDANLAVAKAAALAEAKSLINILMSEEKADISKSKASTVKQKESPTVSKIEASEMSLVKVAAVADVHATKEHQGNAALLLKREVNKTAEGHDGQNIENRQERLGSKVTVQQSLVSTDYDTISDETSSDDDSRSKTLHKRKFCDTKVKHTEGTQRITDTENTVLETGHTKCDINERGVKRQKIGSLTCSDTEKVNTSSERSQVPAKEPVLRPVSSKDMSYSKKRSKSRSS